MIRENDYFLGLRIPEELRQRLQRLADQDNRKLSDYIRLVLIRHTKEKE